MPVAMNYFVERRLNRFDLKGNTVVFVCVCVQQCSETLTPTAQHSLHWAASDKNHIRTDAAGN